MKIENDLTPMMNQYLTIKRDHHDAILFFRMGDFYEMFFDDAKIASSILGLTLTSRTAGKNNRVPMCGIPYHASENYIGRLIAAAKKVAICEQVEDPKTAKGIVKREIVRVVTPGTLITQNMLSDNQNNYLVSIFQKSANEFGLAVVDLSTGEFKITQLNDLQKLLGELTRLNPAELLLSKTIQENPVLFAQITQRANATQSEIEDWTFDYAYSYEKLLSHFKVKNLRGFGAEDLPNAVSAAGAAMTYLEATQKTELTHIKKIRTYSLNKFMVLDSIAQRNLELIRTMNANKKHTLLDELNFTSSAMGNRLIVQWIQQPLLDIRQINERLDAVEELSRDQVLRKSINDNLKNIVDIERLLGRISLNVANARDLFSLNQSLKNFPQLKNILKDSKSKILCQAQNGIDEHRELVEYIDKAIREDAPLSVREARMIKPGFNAELDALITITRGGKEWIASLQRKEIERTGISSLKIKYNRVFGYYIEITKANLGLVPDDYMRKQTLINAERFITPELKEQEEKIVTAQEKMVELEYRLFKDVCKKVLSVLEQIQKSANHIATVDVLNSLGHVASRNNYCRPELNDELAITIKQGRHPVLENLIGREKFIANDTFIDRQDNQILIITGPNMAGKSTYIRQVALIVLMAQMGSFVPAQQACIGVVDRIFTRVGAADDITAGMSTFMMEMSETANILNNTTSRSMIILDEIGRGTSTFDGLSIAWATAEYLNTRSGFRPKTLFATHYHELAEMELMLKGIKNYNVAVKEWNDEVIFLYKLIAGSADHSYGIHVARLAGLPTEVISRAREILSNLEINSVSQDGIPSLVRSDAKKKNEEFQPELFVKKQDPVSLEVQAVDLSRMTPLEALNKIQKWKNDIQQRRKET